MKNKKVCVPVFFHLPVLQLLHSLVFFLAASLLFSCQQVTIIVKDIPGNTPRGAVLFVTGNFNIWDPGDQSFAMKRNEDSTYSITLPRGRGKIEYKFTRGDWTTVERDGCGNHLENRYFELGKADTIVTQILSWEDLGPVNCDKVTFVVKPPANTPVDENIYLVGNFNNWNPKDNKMILEKQKNGLYTISLPRQINHIEYKFTRGGWLREETDEMGDPVPNRKFSYGNIDSVFIRIPGWKDIQTTHNTDKVTFIVKAPQSTPVQDNIYIAGSFNQWYTRDEKYKLEKISDRTYSISLPAREREIEFKFTRGDWDSEEVAEDGNKISNRQFSFGRADTVYIDIPGWIDIPRQ